MAARSTASIIIIGNEILKGQTKDTNSHFLCKELYNCGINVCRITVISDDIDTVSKEVQLSSKLYDYVLTSGGIGPTHDDVTYEGVAKAFDEKLILNKNLQNIFSRLCFSLNVDESAVLKMSHVPNSAEIHHNDHTFIPIVSVNNVFIFPGIPSYLERAFWNLKHLFQKESKPFYTISLYINLNEFNIATCLNEAVKEFESVVRFGSYPDIQNDYYQVKLLLEADSKGALVEAEAFLRSHLPHNSIVGPHPPDSEHAIETLFAIENKMPLKESFEILEKCYKKYSVENTCLSFNGGKDCTVLLHLTFLFLRKRDFLSEKKLKVFYVKSPYLFPEVEHFIDLCIDRYHLQVLTYEHSIKDALSSLKKDHPEIKAVLMGSRFTDPHCSQLLPFQETDSDWPQLTRVHPLLHWSYTQVWSFLKDLQVPYCSLYDRGYTSLGCKHNTLPNDELLNTKSSSYYMPAYMLKDPQQERKGRISSTKS